MYLLFSLGVIFVGSAAYHTYMPACRFGATHPQRCLLGFGLLSR